MPERAAKPLPGWAAEVRGIGHPGLLALLERLHSPGPVGYVIALAVFGAALAARFALDPVLPAGFPFLTFFPAIVTVAFIGGPGPGALCSVLSVLASWYWFIPPRGSFALDGPSAVAVAFFAAIAAFDVWVIHAMTSALQRLKAAQRRADELAQQRTLLFNDLQHRVANSLMMVGSVLSSQQRALADNPQAVAALKTARQRLELMSRLHRRMHDPARTELPLQDYLVDLIGDFVRAQGRPEIDVDIRAADGMHGLDRRTTLGMLVLELVANSLKHGFVDRSGGRIDITFERDPQPNPEGPARWLLRVADDGVGLPVEPRTLAPGERLGMQIAHGMARSLQGELSYAPRPPGHGTCAELRFHHDASDVGTGASATGDARNRGRASPVAAGPTLNAG